MNLSSSFCILIVVLVASTSYHTFSEANSIKKRIIFKGLVGAGLLLKALKPKKGILPLPLPFPLPLPIEWEQPPIIVHPKHNHIPLPHPMPIPVHTPVHVPIHFQQKFIMPHYAQANSDYSFPYDGSYNSHDTWEDGEDEGDSSY